jgi:hypothetical protein
MAIHKYTDSSIVAVNYPSILAEFRIDAIAYNVSQYLTALTRV